MTPDKKLQYLFPIITNLWVDKFIATMIYFLQIPIIKALIAINLTDLTEMMRSNCKRNLQ
jgi:hypothetical protein